MQSMVRFISTDLDVHPVEMVFWRSLFAFVFLVPIVLRQGLGKLRTRRPGLQIVRGVFQAGAMILFWWSLTLIPLAKATAILFSGPIFASFGAVFLLGERSRPRRWLAICGGLAGTLIIVRPGAGTVGFGVLIAVAAAVMFAASKLCIKVLARTDSTTTIVAYMAITVTPITLIPALFVWTWPPLEFYLWILVVAGLGTVAHYFLTQSYRVGELTAVEGVSYTRLIWAALLGYFVFDEIPEIWTWAGSAVIIASAWILASGEAKSAGRAAAVAD